MTGERNLIDSQYQELYAGYYKNAHGTLLKREISAVQTVKYMLQAFAGETFRRLIDVGAGDGNVLAQLDTKAFASELYAVEISESGVEAIRARQLRLLREVRQFDGYKIPYPDKHFDLAIAVHVLEHVEHERLFLRELARIARRVYIEVPLEHGFRIQRAIDNGRKYGHINFYTRETFRNMLESSGLKVIDCRLAAASLEYEQYLSGRTKGLVKNAVRKAALAIAPRLTPWFLVYNGYACCE
jgi:predicted TPR repeat methyltransferase